MATATQKPTAATPSVPSGYLSLEQYEAHERELAERSARRDANRELHVQCLDPLIAAEHEARKPRYEFRVKAAWLGMNTDGQLKNFTGEETLIAQNEDTAWAMFCDRLGHWPNRCDAKPTFKRLREVPIGETLPADLRAIETVLVRPMPKSRRLS